MLSNLDRKEKAIYLRRIGYSYSYILKKVPVSKSTLSYWLSGVSYKPNRETILKIGNARAASSRAKNRIKNESIMEAKKESKEDIGELTKRDIFMLGLGIYIGEGTKTHQIVRVINSNPDIIKFAIKWFKDICGLRNANFRIRLHLYPDTDLRKSIRFWSNSVDLPEKQFQKSQVDKRTNKTLAKRGKLPYGTAHLSIRSLGEKKFGVYLSRKINAWIDEVLK
ncbi:MAG: hypothetical protein AAB507_00190 [Patescibacteria group bacterium]